jgi:hypothetical protein
MPPEVSDRFGAPLRRQYNYVSKVFVVFALAIIFRILGTGSTYSTSFADDFCEEMLRSKKVIISFLSHQRQLKTYLSRNDGQSNTQGTKKALPLSSRHCYNN